MILETMKPEEIEKELMKDWVELFSPFNGKWNNVARAIRKRLINNRSMKFPYSFWKEMKTKTGNTWKIRVTLESRKDVKTGQSTMTYICTYNTSHGRYAIMLINLEQALSEGRVAFQIYSPHLFQRYRDRYKLEPEVSTDKVIEEFFENNSAMVLTKILNLDDEGNVKNAVWMCRDGAIFGEALSVYHYLLKTFIDDSLFKSKQEEVKNLLKEHSEIFQEIMLRPEIQGKENTLNL